MREYCPDTSKPCTHCTIGCEEQIERQGIPIPQRSTGVRKITRYVIACIVCGREEMANTELRGRKVRGVQDAWSDFYARGWNRAQGGEICPACSRKD